jgi:hypothetical protein
MSTVESVASKVVSFIPGVGKVLSKGLKYVSYGLDKGSNAIRADVNGFGNAMNVMDKIQHPLSECMTMLLVACRTPGVTFVSAGGAGGQVLDAIFRRGVGDSDGPILYRRGLAVFVREREFDSEGFFFQRVSSV